MGNLSDVRWGRVLLHGIATNILIFVAVFLVATIYASYLGFQSRGAPDSEAINAFANSASPWLNPIASTTLTFFAARWAARGAKSGKVINGLTVGVMVVLIGWVLAAFVFNGFSFSMVAALETVLVLAACWLGGRAA